MQIAEHVVEFSYTVIVEPEDLEQDENGRWRLTRNAMEGAYDQLCEGITDRSGLDLGDEVGGEWYPRYRVLCQEDFMAGQICERERGHEGAHA